MFSFLYEPWTKNFPDEALPHIEHPPLAGPSYFGNETLPHIALIFCILRA